MIPHLEADKPGGTKWETDWETQGFSMGNKRLKTPGCNKLVGDVVVGERLTGEFFGETQRVQKHTKSHVPAIST